MYFSENFLKVNKYTHTHTHTNVERNRVLAEGTPCIATENMVKHEAVEQFKDTSARTHQRALLEEARRHGKTSPGSTNWYSRRARELQLSLIHI